MSFNAQENRIIHCAGKQIQAGNRGGVKSEQAEVGYRQAVRNKQGQGEQTKMQSLQIQVEPPKQVNSLKQAKQGRTP